MEFEETRRWRHRFSLSLRCFLLSLSAGLPAVALCLALLSHTAMPFSAKWTLGLFTCAVWLLLAWRIWIEISTPLPLLAAALRALEHGDYSVRLAVPKGGHALADIVQSINALGGLLKSQRFHSAETALLLNAVADKIDAAIFTLDHEERVTFVNRAGERLLGLGRAAIVGRSADTARVAAFLRRADLPDAGSEPGAHRLLFSKKSFYSEGRAQTLLVITDLTQPLRQEERLAWQRLIRVLGHEINNSLTPIRSLSAHLIDLVEDLPNGVGSDLKPGLMLVANRSAALTRFISGFARLANVPTPNKSRIEIRPFLEKLSKLETRVPVEVLPGPNIALCADPDQIEQVIINLLRNAAEALLDTPGVIEIAWRLNGGSVRIMIRDEGPGLCNAQNLFVPFFTTKSGGSGIGLALSRQIVESHGGSIALRDRIDRAGCEVVVELPLD